MKLDIDIAKGTTKFPLILLILGFSLFLILNSSSAKAGSCSTCDGGTVVVDESVTVNFNPTTPTCDDGATSDLCDYFSFVKVGTNANNWKAVFDVGAKKLLVKNGTTVTVTDVPTTGSNRKSPGIEILSTCGLEIEEEGTIIVDSYNDLAGNISIKVGGDVTINGNVSNSVGGTGGRPGNITVSACCGDIFTGNVSKIQTVGVDPGGSNINITTCCPDSDIIIYGLVDAKYKGGVASTINIAALEGSVTIDGNTLQEIESGTRRITTGVTVRSTNDPVAGKINIQARNDITVYGNTILSTSPAHINYGTIAVKTGSNSAVGGTIDVRSIDGKIIASDRAFDNENRFNTNAKINLFAKGNIELSVTANKNAGATDNAKVVVSTRAGSAGTGGTNTLRSYSGGISIGKNTTVSAADTTDGTNLLTSCSGITNNGIVDPTDANTADDSGVCTPLAPTGLFTSCGDFGVSCQCPPTQICGNGVIEGTEECDDGVDNGIWCSPPYGGSCNYCKIDCTIGTISDGYCGDGIINGPEQCEDNSDCQSYCDGNMRYYNPFCTSCSCSYSSENCNDQNVCTTDNCDPSGCSHTQINCDDHDVCTVDSCNSISGCQHTQIIGCCHTNADCNDDNACTEDICSNNQCVHNTIPNCPPPAYVPSMSPILMILLIGSLAAIGVKRIKL